jgi:signal transduction histidine kinase/ActR/RegA family two-component response regulator
VSDVPADALERRLLILAPFGRDASLIESMLGKEAVACVACRDSAALIREIERGAGAVILTEEALADHETGLSAHIARQPPWSDLPVLLLTRHGADSPIAGWALETLGNVTLLERPVRVGALASAVRAALRARERQYQTRAHLQERDQASERKDHFLATLAHELRNPLAPIRNSLNLLRLSGPSQVPSPVCEIMERQVDHMVRLVDDLMEVSRITRGKIELKKSPVELTAVLHVALETSRPLIDASRHQLTVKLPAEPLVLDADPMRLAQVFSNLLNNASKYTDPGGSITLTARRDGNEAVVTVSDSGIGISPDALPSVFEMFAQADARDSRSQTGLGIGLTLARSLVEIHGGSVSAASEGTGRGSEFVVRLPLGGSGRVAATAEPGRAATQLRAVPRVLVADDNRDAADTLGALLQVIGAEVRIAHDGRAALDAYDAFQPGVAVLDLGMPGMDGYEVARRIRRRAGTDHVMLVALTGWGQNRDRNLSQAAGFDHHLIKPVNIDTLRALLATVRPDPAGNPGERPQRAPERAHSRG